MGGIAEDHVEWAVINRMKAMLDAPPETPFNVTQSFALFTSIVIWTKNRMWVAGNPGQAREWVLPGDGLAHEARQSLQHTVITDAPWHLSTRTPKLVDIADYAVDQQINRDFEGMPADMFFKWIRDALAHGDGRTTRPLHKPSKDYSKNWLAGFEIDFEEQRRAQRRLCLTLYHADMVRLGSLLADQFCRHLTGGGDYFEDDVATSSIVEASAVRAVAEQQAN